MNRKKHVLTIVVLVAVIIVTLVALSSCDLFGDSQEEEKDLKVQDTLLLHQQKEWQT